MSSQELIQIGLFFGLLIALTPLLGSYMARVFNGELALFRPVENLLYRLAGVDANIEQNWKQFAWALIAFNLLGFIVLLILQLTQGFLALNPQNLANVEPSLAFNTATSFMTNTNWQSYAGESTMSYLTQMLGLTVQNFVSAATGIAVVLGLTRGLLRRSADTIGNFWVDLSRSTLYVLLPLSFILAIVLVSQGVVQNFNPYVQATTLNGEYQLLPQGAAASQIAIKQLGTNGGGFFNVNSAHPYENPTPLSNFLQMLSILLIPSALTYTYGLMVEDKKQGWAIFAAMLILFVLGLGLMLYSEYNSSIPLMEGKELRFGVANSILWGAATTAASNGSVNAMHSSFSPLAGGIALLNIMLGEVIFGGVGAGLYGILIFVILTVFIAGLMVGRSPEYLGKKIEAQEIKMAMLAVLLPNAAILLFSAFAAVTEIGLSSRANLGPHGLTEILYAFSSASMNNGSAFAGLNANTPFYNIALGICMWIGRFGVIIPSLAIAGSLGRKKIVPTSAGTFPTDGIIFVVLLMGVILIVGGLSFFPALSLGPIVEQLLLLAGRSF